MKEKLRLYHGSWNVINVPVPGGGKANTDYGPGFYCTENLELAKEWAANKERWGIVNEYCLHTDGLSFLNLSSGKYHILNWLALLLENRYFDVSSQVARDSKRYIETTFHLDTKEYDIITGYRADDSYFSFAKAFVENRISLEQLGRAIKLGELGEQIVLKSRKAFDAITFVKAYADDGNDYLKKKELRDRTAREQYLEISREKLSMDAVYILDIMRGQWKNDDPRLF